MDGNFWKDRNVVLLGGASLIGTHLAKSLIQRGVKGLRIVDDLSSGSWENIRPLRDAYGLEFKMADLREYANTYNALYKADIVFHMAAQHGGRGYVSGHAVELWNNLELDTTIFRACADVGVEKVIFSSSACAYPIHLQNDIDKLFYLSEDMIDYRNLEPADGAYGTEKLIGEVMLDAYIERGDFRGCSTRSFTVYGPLMKENHAIAALIAKTMIRQEPFEVWGDGNQIRNWTHVNDNVAGALLAAEHLDRGAINIGVEDNLTPRTACYEIWKYMGWHPSNVDYYPEKPVGPKNRVSDATKLKSLGWKPQYAFEEGLHETIDWYVSTHNAEDLCKDFERKLTER